MTIPSTKAEARRVGSSRYNTGKPCKHGHYSDRYLRGQCVECCYWAAKKFREENPEAHRENAKNWDREKERESRRKSFQKHKQKSIRRSLEYQRRHNERYRELNRIQNAKPERRLKLYISTAYRRAMKKNATPEWAETDKINTVYAKARELAERWGVKFHVDHIYPIKSDWVCGLHVWGNLQILEQSMNISKGNRAEWYET